MKALALASLLALGASAACAGEQPSLECNAGAVDRVFGGTHWTVQACDDGKHLAIVTKPGNPAAPFTFIVEMSDDGLFVSGDGTGDKAASDAAYADLEKLSDAEVRALFAQARAGSRGRH
ncbi:MAG: hypothetical protein ACREHE_04280 [Rhizomicrobium sp.]